MPGGKDTNDENKGGSQIISAVSVANSNNATPFTSSSASSSTFSSTSSPAVSPTVVPLLTMVDAVKKGERFGKFHYKINWQLPQALTYNVIIVQEIVIDYEVHYQNVITKKIDIVYNISKFTKDRCCTWADYGKYWEVWFIPTGHKRPKYDKGTSSPSWSNNLVHAEGEDRDDSYSNDQIQNSTWGTVATKGWVRYAGTAQLYRVSKLETGWTKMFKLDEGSPAGVLYTTTKDPQLSPNAAVGIPLAHNMVAYWNMFGVYTMQTEVETVLLEPKVLRGKVAALGKVVSAPPPVTGPIIAAGQPLVQAQSLVHVPAMFVSALTSSAMSSDSSSSSSSSSNGSTSSINLPNSIVQGPKRIGAPPPVYSGSSSSSSTNSQRHSGKKRGLNELASDSDGSAKKQKQVDSFLPSHPDP